MTARERIETLTNGWYGLAVFAALASILQNGIGFFSLFLTGLSTLVSFALTWFLGRRLLARSSVVRSLLVFFSVVFAFTGLLGVARFGLAFVSHFSLGALIDLAVSAGSVYMNVRSFRELGDASVKAYFR